jgi:GDP-L-fucose synthase
MSTKIYIAGMYGMVGKTLHTTLLENGFTKVVGRPSKDLDLRDYNKVIEELSIERPDVLIVAAANVSGLPQSDIKTLQQLTDNLKIELNITSAAFELNIKKLIFISSSTVYSLVSGLIDNDNILDYINEKPSKNNYALSKLVGMVLVGYYRKSYGLDFTNVTPCNLYGPYDRFDSESAHVIPSLIRKISYAKENGIDEIQLIGTGNEKREFLFAPDLAEIIVKLITSDISEYNYDLGSGFEISIIDLASKISSILDYKGKISFNGDYTDNSITKKIGVKPYRILENFKPTSLDAGLRITIESFLSKNENSYSIR